MTAPLRPMNLGEILDRTIQIYRSRFLAFVGVAALPALAMLGLHQIDNTWLHIQAHLKPEWPPGAIMVNILIGIGFYHFSNVFGMFVFPAQVNLVSGSFLDRHASFRASLRFVIARRRSYLWIALLKLLLILVVSEIVAFGLLIGEMALLEALNMDNSDGLQSLLIFLPLPVSAGFTLFLWLSSCFSLAIPAAALEQLRGFRSLRRSWSLSQGTRARVVVTWVAIAITSWVLVFAFQFLLRQFVNYLGHATHSAFYARHLWLPAAYSINTVAATLIGPIYPIAITLFYYDQRIRHEGYDIERMMESAGLNAPKTPPAEESQAASGAEEVQA